MALFILGSGAEKYPLQLISGNYFKWLNMSCSQSLLEHYNLNSGVPSLYHAFWKQFTVADLYKLYRIVDANPLQVIEDIPEPIGMNKAEERVFGFLTSYVGNMSTKTLHHFFTFCDWKLC